MPETVGSGGTQPLADAMRRGDPAAYESLLRSEGGRLLITAQHLLGSEEEARQAVRRAFQVAFETRQQMPEDADAIAWMRRLTVGTSLERLSVLDRPPEEPVEDLVPRFLPTGAHVETFNAWRESAPAEAATEPAAGAVRDAVGRLPSTYRVVLLLHDVEGVPATDLAGILGISANAVTLRLHRARMALRRLIAPHFSGASA